jgi:competence protein ComEC
MWRRLIKYQFKRTTVVFVLCCAILAGIGLARKGVYTDSSWWLVGALGVLVTIKQRQAWLMLAVVLFGMGLGVWRGSVFMTNLNDFDRLAGYKVTIVGRAVADSVYDRNRQLTFDIRNPYVEETGQQLVGKVAVSGFGVNAVYSGDEVRATANLRLARGSYQARVSYAKLEIISQHPSIVADLRRKFMAGMESALPEPVASFGMGLLVGQRNTRPEQTSQILLMVGLTHIIAVSGYNLTILLRASRKLLAKRSKNQALLLSLALIAIFLLFAGSSPSIIRAAIVSMLSIAAVYYGRSFKPLVLIMMAAAITGYAYPYYVWSDIGWYLSFLAFFGVMVLAPMIMARMKARFRDSLVLSVAIESICAEIMTVPLVLHIFGQMSFVALASNVLVVATIPLAMLLSLVAGLAGMLVPAIAGWFAWPALLLLTYMLDIAALLSKIPHVFVENLSLSFSMLLIFYAAIAFATWVLFQSLRLKYGIITDRNQERIEREFL